MNGKTIAIITVVFTALAIVNPAVAYYQNTYPVEQAQTYIWQAESTNNLTLMANHLQKALDILKPYTGNPVWFLPKPDTDWDVIKANIQATISNCRAFEGVSPTNQSYQFALQANQKTCESLADFLSATPSEGESIQTYTTWSPAIIWIEIALVTIAILSGLYAAGNWEN